ncbi:hypothetical protein T484DRAFT_1770936 [Baffinella frigidus]|nr:hypothetical protein T484DRAFT_1770936 [Cryptophyta sp. CCMP2293]
MRDWQVDATEWPPKHWKMHMEMEGGEEKGGKGKGGKGGEAAVGDKVAFIAIRRFERVRLQQAEGS